MATQNEVSTGVLTIRPKPIDITAKGSLRKMRDILRAAEAAKQGEATSIDQMVNIIVENSEITGAEGLDKVALHELLLDEISTDDMKAIMKIIRGADPVSPTNGD